MNQVDVPKYQREWVVTKEKIGKDRKRRRYSLAPAPAVAATGEPCDQLNDDPTAGDEQWLRSNQY